MKAVLRERAEIDKSATYYDLAERAITVMHIQELLAGAASPAATPARPGTPGGDRNTTIEAPAEAQSEEEFGSPFVPQSAGKQEGESAPAPTAPKVSRKDFLKL